MAQPPAKRVYGTFPYLFVTFYICVTTAGLEWILGLLLQVFPNFSVGQTTTARQDWQRPHKTEFGGQDSWSVTDQDNLAGRRPLQKTSLPEDDLAGRPQPA